MNINLTGVEATANKDTDGTLAANSDTKYASQKATKTYVDTGLATKQNTLGYTPENTANKDATGGYVGLTLFKINFKNIANTFTSFFTNTNTAARTYTYQDRNGTIADDTDITNAKARANHTGTQTASTVSDFNTAALAAAPAETTSTLGATINGAAAATPNDTDLVATVESSVVKKITWTNVKAFLKTYFDTLYPTITVYEFSAYSASNQNITTGTWTKVNMDTITRDARSNYSTSNKRYTPTKAGQYLFNAQVYFNSAVHAGCYYYVAFYLNGTLYRNGLFGGATVAGSFTVTAVSTIDMNGSTDYVEMYVWQNNAATQNTYGGLAYTYFEGRLIK